MAFPNFDLFYITYRIVRYEDSGGKIVEHTVSCTDFPE